MTDQTMYVILLGPPGAGKGTQAVQTAERTGLLHLSTGDMFRENLRNGTELGNLAKTYMDKGELVPDDVTIRMLLERIGRDDASAGCLFDGFPRTVEQARALDQALNEQGDEIAVTVLIDVSYEEITRRLGGRVSCASCGSVFHEIFNPPNADSPLLRQREHDPARRRQAGGDRQPLAGLRRSDRAAGRLLHRGWQSVEGERRAVATSSRRRSARCLAGSEQLDSEQLRNRPMSNSQRPRQVILKTDAEASNRCDRPGRMVGETLAELAEMVKPGRKLSELDQYVIDKYERPGSDSDVPRLPGISAHDLRICQ